MTAGYAASGKAPTLDALTGDFYLLPELPWYFTAASLIGLLKRRQGVAALRAMWRGEISFTDKGRSELSRITDGGLR